MTAITGPGQAPMKSGMGKTGNKIPSGYKAGQIQKFTPEMMQLFQQLFGHTGPDSYLSRLASGDEDLFNEIEAPAMRQFQGTLGGIASKFSGMGSGARRSSGFQNATSSAASNFAQELQSQRQGLQRQGLNDLFSLSNTLLGQNPYEQFLTEKKPSFWESVGGDFASSFAKQGGKAGANWLFGG